MGQGALHTVTAECVVVCDRTLFLEGVMAEPSAEMNSSTLPTAAHCTLDLVKGGKVYFGCPHSISHTTLLTAY